MRSRIHINQHIIKHNAKHGTMYPVCTVKQGNSNRYAMRVQILGPSEVVYEPNDPLSCGAKVWVETDGEVILIDEKTYADIKELMQA